MESGIQQLRQRFYNWRQRRPLKRGLAFAALLILWPPLWIARRLLSKKETPQRILAIHLAGLGDTLMLTPALASLQGAYPNAKLDLLTLHPYVRDAFSSHARLASVITLPTYEGNWIISRFANKSRRQILLAIVRYYPDLILKLALTRYEIGINFSLSDFDATVGNGLLYCLNTPIRVGASGVNADLLTHSSAMNYTHVHRVQAYLSLLAPLSISSSSQRYEYYVSNQDADAVRALLDAEQVESSRPLAVVHPGGKLHINSRRWPAEYFSRVCIFLASKGFEILLAGDDHDAVVCDEIKRTVGSDVKSIAGRLNFTESAALLSKCDLVITNDTATLHLAEAMQVPRVISIFGPTDPSVLAPQNDRHIVFRSNLPCAPCMGGVIDERTERCPREIKEECLWQTTPEQVINVLRRLDTEPMARLARA